MASGSLYTGAIRGRKKTVGEVNPHMGDKYSAIPKIFKSRNWQRESDSVDPLHSKHQTTPKICGGTNFKGEEKREVKSILSCGGVECSCLSCGRESLFLPKFARKGLESIPMGCDPSYYGKQKGRVMILNQSREME